jgi:hypothetical protein
MKDLSLSGSPVTTLKVGDLVSAKYSLDGEWYRGRVRRVMADKKADVLFIDYGNVRMQCITLVILTSTRSEHLTDVKLYCICVFILVSESIICMLILAFVQPMSIQISFF